MMGSDVSYSIGKASAESRHSWSVRTSAVGCFAATNRAPAPRCGRTSLSRQRSANHQRVHCTRLTAPRSLLPGGRAVEQEGREPREAVRDRSRESSNVMRAMSEFSSRSTARKAASPSESPNPPPPPDHPALSFPPAHPRAATLAQSPEDPPENPAPVTTKRRGPERESSRWDLDAGWFADGPPNRGGGPSG